MTRIQQLALALLIVTLIGVVAWLVLSQNSFKTSEVQEVSHPVTAATSSETTIDIETAPYKFEPVPIETLTPTGSPNGQTVMLDGVTVTIPSKWRVQDVSMAESGRTEGFFIYSPDFQDAVVDTSLYLIGDSNEAAKGMKVTVAYDTEPVAPTIEDSYDYIRFIGASNVFENTISNSFYIVDNVPLVAFRSRYSSNQAPTESEWYMVRGRHDGKSISIWFMYAGTYEENADTIKTILSTFKF